MKDTIVFYHADCTDGFGGAYAAWKKFGDSAEYIPLRHSDPVPHVERKEIFFIDFAYPKEILAEIEKNNKRLVVLDHHIGLKDAIESVREYVFDNDRSGAGIAWHYFHPEKPFPRFLKYVQEKDLWKRTLPESEAVGISVYMTPLTFSDFEKRIAEFEDDTSFAKIIEKSVAYQEYFNHVVQAIASEAEEVVFDGYTVLAVNASRNFRSHVGNLLAQKQGPFGVVFYFDHGRWHFSLRGNGALDLSEFTKKYGGGGHKNAAGFFLSEGAPFPFKRLH